MITNKQTRTLLDNIIIIQANKQADKYTTRRRYYNASLPTRRQAHYSTALLQGELTVN